MTSPRNSQRFWIPALVVAAVVLGVGLAFALFSSSPPDDIDATTHYPTSRTKDTPRNEDGEDSSTSPDSSEPSSSSGASSSHASEHTSNSPAGTGSDTADGYDDFGACDEEAHTFCSGFYGSDWSSWAIAHDYINASWKLGLVDCLGAHEAENSAECNASLDRRAGLNDDVNTMCQTDRAKYCTGVEPEPGSEPQVDCLKDHYEELASACAEAVDAHENAKPEGQQDFSYRE